mmetsp:Transcript_941/g.2144  ORF Transcript_941/g.2144 Transcript_941/m.2144 type:complete len:84 (+) Transcript_941:209-460(+)
MPVKLRYTSLKNVCSILNTNNTGLTTALIKSTTTWAIRALTSWTNKMNARTVCRSITRREASNASAANPARIDIARAARWLMG